MTEIVSRNPATGAVVATLPASTPAHIDAVIACAAVAQASWAALSCRARAPYVRAVRDLVMKEADALSRLVSEENGKPLAEAFSADIFPVIDILSLFARKAGAWLRRERIPLGKWGFFGRTSVVEYRPYGVVAVISPWNFPFSIPFGQIAMALMAGNAVVLKPSEITPRIGLAIADLCERAGLPKGLVQVVLGAGDVGDYLVRHPGIQKIVFTGSVETGKKIMAAASVNLTPVTLELGGKDPMIVLADANLEVATSAALWGAFTNCGQCCASVERLYVHESIYHAFVARLIAKANTLVIDAAANSRSDIGPMTFERQRQKVMAHVEDAKGRGAEVLWQAAVPSASGYFYPPTILAKVDHRFPVMREETFGPVLPIMTFKDEAEAVRLANDSPYALTASVWSRDLGKARRLARQVEAGTVAINELLYTHALSQTPWGGPKKSGIGRTHGRLGLLELVEARHIHTNHFGFMKSPWWYPYAGGKVIGLKALGDLFFSRSLKRRLKAVLDLRYLRKVT